MKHFLTYKKFQHLEEAQEVIDVLETNNVKYFLEDNTLNVPEFMVGQSSDSPVLLKIDPKDFVRVNELLEELNAAIVDQIDTDYHLFSFENEELMEVLAEPEKWSELDRELAKKILGQRGVTISNEVKDLLYEKRIKELKKKETGSTIWTIVGYLSALLGGLIGIAIGIHLWTSKRTLPDGTRTYVYRETDRTHGMIIALIGIVMFLVFVTYRIL